MRGKALVTATIWLAWLRQSRECPSSGLPGPSLDLPPAFDAARLGIMFQSCRRRNLTPALPPFEGPFRPLSLPGPGPLGKGVRR